VITTSTPGHPAFPDHHIMTASFFVDEGKSNMLTVRNKMMASEKNANMSEKSHLVPV
jgi:hypothetical protein